MYKHTQTHAQTCWHLSRCDDTHSHTVVHPLNSTLTITSKFLTMTLKPSLNREQPFKVVKTGQTIPWNANLKPKFVHTDMAKHAHTHRHACKHMYTHTHERHLPLLCCSIFHWAETPQRLYLLFRNSGEVSSSAVCPFFNKQHTAELNHIIAAVRVCVCMPVCTSVVLLGRTGELVQNKGMCAFAI